MSELRKIKRALISVSDKTGLGEFAAVLADLGAEMISILKSASAAASSASPVLSETLMRARVIFFKSLIKTKKRPI